MATGLASANSISNIDTQGIVTFNTDGTYTLTLSKFNLAGTTLTGAALYFDGMEVVSTINLSNSASTTQTFDALATSNLVFGATNTANNTDRYTGETLDLFDTGIGPGTAQLPTTQAPITLGPVGSPVCPEATPSASCNSVDYTPPSEVVNNTDAIYALPTGIGLLGVDGVVKNITGGDLANYTGAGTFNLAGATKGLTTFSGGGNNIGFNINTQASFEAEIDYTYTVNSGTPEPTTMALMGGALIGLGLLGKRFKKS
jgi:hypothetical protein